MPNVKNQVFRIRIIDELLRKQEWVTTQKMQRDIIHRLGYSVTLRTIQNDIDDMKYSTKLNYNAPIEFNKTRNAHRYTDHAYSINRFALRNEEITALQFYAECLQAFSGYKLFDSFSSGIKKVIDGVVVRNQLKTTTNPRTIIQTDTLVTPAGQEYLEQLVVAIENKLICTLTYQQYGDIAVHTRTAQPLFLKEYRNRWYLLAYRLDKKQLRTYALDRIKSLAVSDKEISSPYDFNPDAYFKYSFGITTPDKKVEKVVLRFSKREAPYIISLPIHPTQIILKNTARSITIQIEVLLSYELIDFILSKTPEVKVISPTSLVRDISLKIEKGLALYKKK